MGKLKSCRKVISGLRGSLVQCTTICCDITPFAVTSRHLPFTISFRQPFWNGLYQIWASVNPVHIPGCSNSTIQLLARHYVPIHTSFCYMLIWGSCGVHCVSMSLWTLLQCRSMSDYGSMGETTGDIDEKRDNVSKVSLHGPVSTHFYTHPTFRRKC